MMSDNREARRKVAETKGNALIDGTVAAYMRTLNYDQTGLEPYIQDPTNAQRDVIYLLIKKERMYIDALRALTAGWQGKSASLMPPAILTAIACIQAYERTVEGKMQPADDAANDGQ